MPPQPTRYRNGEAPRLRPDALIRAIPSPKQKWKLPVKYWVHEPHFKRFGEVLGEKPMDLTPADLPACNRGQPGALGIRRRRRPVLSVRPSSSCPVITSDAGLVEAPEASWSRGASFSPPRLLRRRMSGAEAAGRRSGRQGSHVKPALYVSGIKKLRPCGCAANAP